MDEKAKHQQIIIKICCVVAAFVLWLYTSNVENPIREYDLKDVPVELINKDSVLNSKLAIISGQQFKVDLKLKGPSSEIFLSKANKFKIVGDLSQYVVSKGENRVPIEVKMKPDNVNILNGANLWVQVNLDELMQKTIPITVAIEGKVKQGYFALSPILKINSAFVSGPAQILNSVAKIEVKCDIGNISSDLNVNLPMQALDVNGKEIISPELKIQPNNIDVSVSVRKMKSVVINAKTKGNISKDLIIKSMTTNPQKVDIYGEDNSITDINSLDTEIIDLSNLNNKMEFDAKLVLPKGVKLANANEYIKFKLEVDKIIQKNLSLDIVAKNLIASNDTTLDVSKASLIISGPENILNSLKNEDIVCYVDLQQLEQGSYTVPIKIDLPNGVSKISSSPEAVKVTIKKKIS